MSTADGRAAAIAAAFTQARRTAQPLPSFPGDLPATRADAYAAQDAAIASWPARLVGWKVAGVAPEFRERFGAPRLAGPAFAPRLYQADGSAVRFSIFPGGFAAVEAEFILRVGADIDAADAADEDRLAEKVSALHGGAEIAGSPFADINRLGPLSVVSDFGNNGGLILGDAIANWRERPLESLKSRTSVNGAVVGEGDASRVAGGPLAALGFLVTALAERGRRLRAGDLVSTGMTTGIHPVTIGDEVLIEFSEGRPIRAVAIAETPTA
ncbi:MAG: hypothetical protein BGP06_03475 [Rhizobiales bacterium 65-9]|nr:hypothetical protein [Hyphomicrobiales bacterium]OJY32756.1 MAG: hypothetical protein BGP06_03475 [Rhizobiales bacterium 65-9]